MISFDKLNIWNLTALDNEISELEQEIRSQEDMKDFEQLRRSMKIRNRAEYDKIVEELNKEWIEPT